MGLSLYVSPLVSSMSASCGGKSWQRFGLAQCLSPSVLCGSTPLPGSEWWVSSSESLKGRVQKTCWFMIIGDYTNQYVGDYGKSQRKRHGVLKTVQFNERVLNLKMNLHNLCMSTCSVFQSGCSFYSGTSEIL